MLGEPHDETELRQLADDTARDARAYLDTVTELASGGVEDSALAILMLALSSIISTGARLGAVQDIFLEELYEPDSGPDADLDDLHMGLANLLEGLDEYADIVDPLVSTELTQGSLANDLTEVAAALGHGLAHYDKGRANEALWWWQYSFMSSWGERAIAGLRMLVCMLGHIRLDVDMPGFEDVEG